MLPEAGKRILGEGRGRGGKGRLEILKGASSVRCLTPGMN